MAGVPVGIGYLDIKPDMSRFSRDLKANVTRNIAVVGDEAGKSLSSSLTTAIKGAALTFGAAFGAAKAFGFLSSAVSGASDLTEALSKSNNVFGESALLISSWAKTGAESFGLSQRAALDAAGTFGNMFAQLGIGSQQAAQMSTQMVQLAADFASFHNANIEDVIAAQSAAFRGEYDALQRFLPLISAATVEQRALQLTGKRTTDSLTAQDKALAVNALMFEGAGDAAGDFARTSGNLANEQRSLQAAFENAKAELGQGLLPMITLVVNFLNKEAIPAFEQFFSMGDKPPVTTGFQGFVADMKDLSNDVAAFSLTTVGLASKLFGTISPRFREVGQQTDEWAAKLHMSSEELYASSHATRNLDVAAKGYSDTVKKLPGAVDQFSKSLVDNEKATRDAAKAGRDLHHAQKDLAKLIAEGPISEQAIIDARRSLADATRSAAHADRELGKAQEDYNEALANANDLKGWDTAQEHLADAAENLADARENAADVHQRAVDAEKELKAAQAGDPDFQDKLADAKDRVADAQDRVNTAADKLIKASPGVVNAIDLQASALEALGITADEVTAKLKALYASDSGNILTGLSAASIQTAGTAPQLDWRAWLQTQEGLPVPQGPGAPAPSIVSAPKTVTVNQTFTQPADPLHIARQMVWALD